MKFTTETSALKEALQRLGYAVNTKSILPVLSGILVDVQDGSIELTASDLQVTIAYTLKCVTDGLGKFIVPYSKLKDIVSLETGEVTIEWSESLGAIVQFSKDVFRLGNQGKVEEFPKTPKVAKDRMFTINSDIVNAIKTAAISTGKDEIKPVLCAICLELSETETIIISTDASSLYCHKLPPIEGVKESTEVLIQSVLAKIIEAGSEIKIGFNSNNIAFEFDNVKVLSKRIDLKYVAWRSVFPEHETNAIVNYNDFETAVAKAFVMSSPVTFGVELNPSEKQLRMISNDSSEGTSCDITIDANCSTNVERITFNGRFIKRAISQLPNQSDVEMSINATNKAVTMKSSGVDEVTVLLMPITTN
jgi:DNA polymerase III subunit beta